MCLFHLIDQFLTFLLFFFLPVSSTIVYTPTSGLLHAGSIKSNNKLGALYGRGRLGDSDGYFRSACAISPCDKYRHYWMVKVPGSYWHSNQKKIIGFTVMSPPNLPMEYVQNWEISYLRFNVNKFEWVALKCDVCSSSSSDAYYFHTHEATTSGQKIHILFRTPVYAMQMAFHPIYFQGAPSAKLALLLESETTTTSLPNHLPIKQFGLKFKGNIFISEKGNYKFRVATSHPFQLAINGQALINRFRAGIGYNTISFKKPGYYLIQANYFYYGQ